MFFNNFVIMWFLIFYLFFGIIRLVLLVGQIFFHIIQHALCYASLLLFACDFYFKLIINLFFGNFLIVLKQLLIY
jgi:hypothetical protein